MSEYHDALDEFLAEPQVDPAEYAKRIVAMTKVADMYRVHSDAQVRALVDATLEIPAYWFGLACKLVFRTRVYPTMPAPGEFWRIAQSAAGMDREQYDAGRYVPPSRDWPPAGQRHAIQAGELETVPRQLSAGQAQALLPSGNQTEPGQRADST